MKIALTFTGSEHKHHNYVRWLKASDDIELVIISPMENNLKEVKKCDGLLLAGGRDLHPQLYNSKNIHYHNAPEYFDEKRDSFEAESFNIAMEKELPVLAVCRGMQLVNCILGGSLVQDLGDILNRIHKREGGKDKAHGINIVPGTLFNKIAEAERTVANSAHHQSIDRLGKGLKVNCMADDSTIEGLEWAEPKGKPFLLCVQWHPERMAGFQLDDSPASKNIRETFIKEIKSSMK